MFRSFQLWVLRRCFSLEDLEWEVLTRKIVLAERSYHLRNQQLESKKQQEKTTGKKSKKSSKASDSKGLAPRGVQPTSSGLATLPSGEIIIPTQEVRGLQISSKTRTGIEGVVDYPPKQIPSGSIFKALKEWGTRD